MAIKQLANDLENRERSGDMLDPAEVRAVAKRLQAYVANLMSAVGRMR